MPSPETRLDQYLHEALALERTLTTTLQAHYQQTPPGAYRKLLARHLEETRTHAAALSNRLGAADTSLAHAALGLAYSALGQAFNLAKAPLDLVRGGAQPDLVKNARDEAASEALEIALYDAVEALAEAVGDDATATLARSHRAEEERMLDDLRALIPTLAAPGRARPTVPIADYDDLNAGQITARLAELSQEDLGRVLDHERRNRNRRAVVERAEQLTGTPPWPGYDRDDTPAILARLDADTAPAVREYETRHRRRVAVLEAAQQALTNT